MKKYHSDPSAAAKAFIEETLGFRIWGSDFLGEPFETKIKNVSIGCDSPHYDHATREVYLGPYHRKIHMNVHEYGHAAIDFAQRVGVKILNQKGYKVEYQIPNYLFGESFCMWFEREFDLKNKNYLRFTGKTIEHYGATFGLFRNWAPGMIKKSGEDMLGKFLIFVPGGFSYLKHWKKWVRKIDSKKLEIPEELRL